MASFTKSSDAKMIFCGICDAAFTVLNSLCRHRDSFHSKNHMCLVCDPINGKLIEGIKIKTHLAEVHGFDDTHSCGCCHYIMLNRQQLETHKVSLKNTGTIGNEVILAKSDNEPGSLMQKNTYEKYLAQSFLEASEDKENTSQAVLAAKKSSRNCQMSSPLTNSSVSDSKMFFCGICDAAFIVYSSLCRHRDRFHSDHHTCFACDPINGKLIKGIRIKTHLTEVHGFEDTHSCGCCHHVFLNRQLLKSHKMSVKNKGTLGSEVILAKSDNEPGSLLQENMGDRHEKYLVQSFLEISEDKENASEAVPPAKKSSRKRASRDAEKSPDTKKTKIMNQEEVQTFFDILLIPLLKEFHEKQQNGQK